MVQQQSWAGSSSEWNFAGRFHPRPDPKSTLRVLPKIKFIKTVEDDELQKYPVITPLVLSIELCKGQGGFLQKFCDFFDKTVCSKGLESFELLQVGRWS